MDYIIDIDHLNIHVADSYLVTDKKQIREEVKAIMADPKFEDLRAAGFTRTEQSMVNEWAAHNTLYRWKYKQDRTKSVDIDQGESSLRLFIYCILANI